MKFNWKVLIALIVLIGAIFWGVDSVRTRSYSGTNLNVGIGSGPMTVTNSTDTSTPVQFVSTGSRPFSVSSTSAGALGSSTRQGSGRTTTQMFEFELPPGITEFMIVARGSAVSFVADTLSSLDVTVQPLIENDARTTMIVATIVILGTLFYVSSTTGHRWIRRFRVEKASLEDTQPSTGLATTNPNIGQDGRMYSDL
jgi:hypothetical protein